MSGIKTVLQVKSFKKHSCKTSSSEHGGGGGLTVGLDDLTFSSKLNDSIIL